MCCGRREAFGHVEKRKGSIAVTAALDRSFPPGLDVASLPTPCFVVDEGLLARNCRTLTEVIRRTDCRILLALKGYACWSTFPLIKRFLHGCCASSVHEARLAREEFGGEVHAFAAAFSETDVLELAGLCDHVVFNSHHQLDLLGPKALGEAARRKRTLHLGLRVNPGHSEGRTPLYDPAAPGSRLGVTGSAFDPAALERISGLHFHTLCEHNADALERTLTVFMAKFGAFLPRLSWINLGGGHHITRPDYDVDLLVRLLSDLRARSGLTVYLEPGEAVALDAGVLVATVLDIVENNGRIAILDASAAAHMPDVLEMPYTPRVALEGINASPSDQGEGRRDHLFRLAGHSCLAGDVIGAYAFHRPLRRGDRLVFMDMAIYSMVKTTTFNGLQLPSILRRTQEGEVVLQRAFTYQDYKGRLS